MTSVHSIISPSKEDKSVTNERQIASDILKETIKYFHGVMIQSTIRNSAYYDSEEHDAVSDPKSDSLVATSTSNGNKRKITDTDTTNGNSPHRLISNQIIPKIIPGAIYPIDQTIMEYVAGIVETLDAHQTVISKEIVTDVAHSGARIFRTPREVRRTGRDGTTPRDGNIVVEADRLTSPIKICQSTTDSPSQNRNQDIINPIGPVSSQYIRIPRNSKLLLMDFSTEDRGIKTIFSKVVGFKLADDSRVDVN